jgi:alkanesulfonate monooxygenase SsuD/methylene tetrahydromethanopterin reductase-like flavin-dependent oxidoreductase (luciferase family)
MRFGVNFFPTVGPEDKDPVRYFQEALRLAELAEDLGFDHVKTVEHYFARYGGYSPDPGTFRAAVAARTSRIRLVTGAVIPAFTHPVKLAGKLAMLDNLSAGRLDVGFGRAFLPEEFAAFEIPMDESRPRFDEGVEACRRLWEHEQVVWEGRFYRFGPVTLLPRTHQRPRPPILVAAAISAESCEAAGRSGYGLMLVPSIHKAETLQEMLNLYRKAWADAGHGPGQGPVHMSYNCYLAGDGPEARRLGRRYSEHANAALAEAVSSWATTRSTGYSGYEKIVDRIAGTDFGRQLAQHKVLVGTPDAVLESLAVIKSQFGEVTISLQAISGNQPAEESERTMRLFARHVLPAAP